MKMEIGNGVILKNDFAILQMSCFKVQRCLGKPIKRLTSSTVCGSEISRLQLEDRQTQLLEEVEL